MKRRSTLGLIGAAFLVASLSLTGCGNTSRTRTGTGTGNNAANNMQNGTNYTRDNATNNLRDGTSNFGNNSTSNSPGNSNNSGTSNSGPNITRNNAADNTAGNAMQYTAQNFRDDITKAGYKVTDLANNTKNYFRGKETDYRLGGDVVRVYEYNSAADLDADIGRIAPNGMTINGTDANYTTKPHYYRKGNSLIVYEGKEPAYIDEFNRSYGSTLRP